MNIALYANTFLPTIGGRELVVHHLARELKQMGHRVRVIGPSGWWSQRRFKLEYPVHRWPALRGILKEQIWFTHLLLHSTIRGCDVIHAHITYPAGYIAARLKGLKDIPLVITPHGADIHVIPELGHGLRLNPLLAPKIDYALQRAELLTAISDSVEASLLAAGAPRDRIRKIPNGVDIERFKKPITVDVRKWLNLAADSRLVLTVGNYRPLKGQEVLIRSMPLILAREPRTCLIIVGRNSQALQPLIRKLNLEDNVRLTGSIHFPAVPTEMDASQSTSREPDWLAALYRSSELYASASRDNGAEGLSLAVLEAMAAGLPVVGTNISGNQDIIKDGDNGFLVQPEDPAQVAEAVLKLLGSDQLRTNMCVKAKKMAMQYQWREITNEYLAVYNEARENCKKNSSRGRT